MSAWINTAGTNPNNSFPNIVGNAGAGGNEGYSLLEYNVPSPSITDQVVAYARNNNYNSAPASGTATETSGTWNQFTAVYSYDTLDGNNRGPITLYENGVSVGTGTADQLSTPTYNLIFGGDTNSANYLSGQLTEVAIWNKALSPGVVLQDYQAYVVPEPVSLSLLVAGVPLLLLRRRRQAI